MNATQLAALRTELTTDPFGYGYAGPLGTGSDTVLADMLNFIRDGATAPTTGNVGPAIPGIKRADISPQEVIEAIDVADFVANPTAQNVPNPVLAASWFESMTQLSRVRLKNEDGGNTRVIANLNKLLSGVSQTRIAALSTRFGSRAEQMFGRDTRVTDLDVSAALVGTR